jgi:hypothetical protein
VDQQRDDKGIHTVGSAARRCKTLSKLLSIEEREEKKRPETAGTHKEAGSVTEASRVDCVSSRLFHSFNTSVFSITVNGPLNTVASLYVF